MKRKICRFFVVFQLAALLLALGARAQSSTSVENLTSVSSVTVKNGLGFNMANLNNEWEFQMAQAAGSTEARFQPGWGAVQNMAGTFSMPTIDETALGWCSTYGFHPLLVAAYGPPYQSIGNFTVAQAYPVGTTSIKLNESLSSVVVPYCHVQGAGNSQIVAEGRWGYYGALITGVDTSSGTITLASATTGTLTLGGTLVINKLLYPSCATASPTDPSVVAYANYVAYIAGRIPAHGLTGRVEIWNEPPWAHDPWDHRGGFYDTVPMGITPYSPNFGIAENLVQTTAPTGVHYNWAGPNKTGFASVLTSKMSPSITGTEVANSISCEGFHPYGNSPEDGIWDPNILAGVTNANNSYTAILPGANWSGNTVYARYLNLQNPSLGFKQNITETGCAVQDGVRKARFDIRQYLAYLADGLERVTFYCFGQPNAAVSPFTSTGNAAYSSGVNTITFSPLPTGLVLGDVFSSGTGIPVGASVTAINTSTGVVTLSAKTTLAGAAHQTITFDQVATLGFVDSNHVDGSGNHLVSQAYTAIQGLVAQDMAVIPVAPVTYNPSTDLPTVPSYSGTYPLTTMSIVGRRSSSDTKNIIYYVAWQRSHVPPGPVTNLAVTSTTGSVSLSFSPNGFAVTDKIMRGTTSGTYTTTLTSTLPFTQGTYKDTTAVPGTTYYYVIVGNNPAGVSSNSNEVSATAASSGSGTFNNNSKPAGPGLVSWTTISSPPAANVTTQLPAGYAAIDAWDLVTRNEVPFTTSGTTATYPVSDNPVCLEVVPAVFFANFNGDTVGSAPTTATYSSTSINLKPTAALVTTGEGTLTVASTFGGLTDQPVQFAKVGTADYRPSLEFVAPSATPLVTTSGVVSMEWDETISSFTPAAHTTEALLTNRLVASGSGLSLNWYVNSTTGGVIQFSPNTPPNTSPAWSFNTPVHFKLVINVTAGTYSAWANGVQFANAQTLSVTNVLGVKMEDGNAVGGYDGTWNAAIDNVWISTGLY
jgi:hypothetical protein